MSRKNRHAAMIEERAPLSTVSFPIDLQGTSAQIPSHGAPNTRERGQLSGFTITSQSQLSRRSVAATVAAQSQLVFYTKYEGMGFDQNPCYE